jgi:serine phosphatase RsbU (regulator of sigma subunit)
MRSFDELTYFLDRMEAADSFHAAEKELTDWAQTVTGCHTVLLRMVQEDQDSSWLPICGHSGPSPEFLRDETIIRQGECICGLVAAGRTDDSPFFTSKGSFIWGRVQSMEQEFGRELIDSVRGRCIIEGYDSVAIFPLLAGERRVGSLHLADFAHEHWRDSIGLVESACTLAGRILLRHQQREREQMAFSLIQQALLPPRPPLVPGLEIGLSFSSATELAQIGGDFYEILDLGERGTLLLVGDYSGKGIEAAGLAAQARYTMATLARLDPTPGRLLEAANQTLATMLPPGGFVTCAACLLDPREGNLRVALAGHPAPFLAGEWGSREMEHEAQLPLGISPRTAYQESSASLAPGDVLIMYTDGITDARQDGRLFGVEGISLACDRLGLSCLQDLADGICQESTSFHQRSSSSDDRLVMAVCRRRVPGLLQRQPGVFHRG